MRTPQQPEIVANLEGRVELERTWQRNLARSGSMTAVARVTNGALNLPHVLPPLLRTFDSLVVVDNGSTDDTLEIARNLIEESGASDRVQLLEYPFNVARRGSEHQQTAPNSVHSLTHFYNWIFSHASDHYTIKWDGDMVLTSIGETLFEELKWRIAKSSFEIGFGLIQVWVSTRGKAHIDTFSATNELRVRPNRPDFVYAKGLYSEVQVGPQLPIIRLPIGSMLQIRRVDEGMIGRWTSTPDADVPGTSWSARRELEVASALADGRSDPYLVEIIDPEGDVVELIRRMGPLRWNDLRPKKSAAEAQRLEVERRRQAARHEQLRVPGTPPVPA